MCQCNKLSIFFFIEYRFAFVFFLSFDPFVSLFIFRAWNLKIQSNKLREPEPNSQKHLLGVVDSSSDEDDNNVDNDNNTDSDEIAPTQAKKRNVATIVPIKKKKKNDEESQLIELSDSD